MIVTAVNVSHDVIYLQWLPIPADKVPGTLLGYVIQYKLVTILDTLVSAFRVGPTVNETLIQDLKPSSEYIIQVAGYNSIGSGPFAGVFIKTGKNGT